MAEVAALVGGSAVWRAPATIWAKRIGSRRRPGIKLTLTSVALLGSLVQRNGSLNLVITLAIALPVGVTLGYRYFVRTGEL